MGIILPTYLLHEKRFKCSRCSFAFVKNGPSKVEKCPMCDRNQVVVPVIARGYTEADLDPYSKTKLRWYSEASGKAHLEDIGNRKIIRKDGKEKVVITDSRGREIEEMPIPPIPKKQTKFISENAPRQKLNI